jgi:hypothetical protein
MSEMLDSWLSQIQPKKEEEKEPYFSYVHQTHGIVRKVHFHG